MLHHPLTQRFALLVGVVGFHILAIVTLTGPASHIPGNSSARVAMTTIFLRPTIREDDGRTMDLDLTQLTIPIDVRMQALKLDSVGPENSVPRNESASVAAPSLQSSLTMEPYLAQAALLPGEGATVVLKIEVQDSGEPGQITVDVSSGSSQVDAAAIAYARASRWYAGRIDGEPKPMWIRWGVRLQA